jgi:tetratricopeptide (TPR) repeat protein
MRLISTPGVRWGGTLLVAAVLGWGLGPLLHGAFVFDDSMNIVDNPMLHEGLAKSLAAIWTQTYAGMYIPVTYTAWALLTWSLGTGSAYYFHLTNVIVHLANAWLVFRLLRRLLGDRAPLAGAVVGALFFAVHPMQVEAFAWVTGLKDLLGAFFSLLALVYWFSCLDAGERKRSLRAYGLATFCFLLAILAKPSSAILPLIVILATWAVKPSALRPPFVRRLLPWLAMAAAAVALAKFAQSSDDPDHMFMVALPLVERCLVAVNSLGFYLAKLLWPHPLTLDYGLSPLFALSHPRPNLLCAGLFLFTLAVFSCFSLSPQRSRNRLALLGGLTFIVGVAPTLGLVPFFFQNVSTVADRYAYFAQWGMALVVGLSVDFFVGERPSKTVKVFARGISSLVLVLLCLASFRQTICWQNNLTLYTHCIDGNPHSWFCHEARGLELARLHEYSRAHLEFDAAIALNPERFQSMYAKARVLRLQHRNEESDVFIARAADIFGAQLLSRGTELLKTGRYDVAERFFSLATRTLPNSAEALAQWGEALFRQGQRDEARNRFLRALSLSPGFAPAEKGLEQLKASGR